MSRELRGGGILAEYMLKLVPVTPIHVWAGENAVNGVDAFVRGGYLYLLTPSSLEQVTPEDLEKIVRLAKRPEEALARTFETLVSKGAIEPLAQVRASVTPKAEIRLLHKNLIPGSTIKGYIRTAIMRYMLNLMKPGQLASVIESGVDLGGDRKPARLSEGLEANLFRRPRPRKQGGFVDAMALLLVSDPEVVERRLSVRELYVVHRHNPGSIVARVLAVVLDPAERETTRYEVKVLAPMSDSGISSLATRETERQNELSDVLDMKRAFAQVLSRGTLLEALRNHGCALLDLERRKAHESLTDYRKLLEDLRRDMCEKKSGCVPARIGFMTGHEAKTVLDLVSQHAPKVYEGVVDLMRQHVKRTWDAHTLKLVDYEGKMVGVGWCRLCVE